MMMMIVVKIIMMSVVTMATIMINVGGHTDDVCAC